MLVLLVILFTTDDFQSIKFWLNDSTKVFTRSISTDSATEHMSRENAVFQGCRITHA